MAGAWDISGTCGSTGLLLSASALASVSSKSFIPTCMIGLVGVPAEVVEKAKYFIVFMLWTPSYTMRDPSVIGSICSIETSVYLSERDSGGSPLHTTGALYIVPEVVLLYVHEFGGAEVGWDNQLIVYVVRDGCEWTIPKRGSTPS